ncbi:MAG: cytochrome c [Acidobacteria bacterium]|nr:cytochrome c [Acidobacteriota bacterium]
MMRRATIGAALSAAAAVLLVAGPALAGGGVEEVPTFTKDVAPILFDNCVTCHRPGNIAPMSLTSYAESRPWARSIKDLVVSRTMPPWPADPDNSLAFRNERRLDQAQIDTIAAWVDGGAPRGLAADLPALPDFPEGWTYEGGEPDYVFELPVEYTIAAEGEEDYIDFYSAIPWDEDRFAEVLELKPSNYAVVHHSGAYVVDLPAGKRVVDGVLVDDPNAQAAAEESADGSGRVAQPVFNEVNLPGTSKLLSYVPGRGVERHRPGTGKRLTAGKWIRWTMHYNPTGRPEVERSKLGIWFNTVAVTHEVLTRQAGNAFPTDPFGTDIYIVEGEEIKPTRDADGSVRRAKIPNIPPYEDDWKITGITPITEPITLYGLSPHMHLRGKSLKWVVTYPDGSEVTVLDVPRFDFNWQIHYELAEPLRLPAGSKITGIGVYDNSLNNRWNPGPHLEVYWGQQSWDEMYQAFTEYTVESQDLTKPGRATDDDE